jgi:hypothetical protein
MRDRFTLKMPRDPLFKSARRAYDAVCSFCMDLHYQLEVASFRPWTLSSFFSGVCLAAFPTPLLQ